MRTSLPILVLLLSCGPRSHAEDATVAAPSSVAALPQYQAAWNLKKEVYDKANASLGSRAWRNARYVTIVDFSQHSSKRRLYLFDLNSGTVEQHNVAVGRGSDGNGDGIAESFSDTDGSHQSSLGAYATAEAYVGKHGYSLRLDGLDATNSSARAREIVVHGAEYVVDGARAGRSWGCPALDPSISRGVIGRIKGGSLLYIGN